MGVCVAIAMCSCLCVRSCCCECRCSCVCVVEEGGDVGVFFFSVQPIIIRSQFAWVAALAQRTLGMPQAACVIKHTGRQHVVAHRRLAHGLQKITYLIRHRSEPLAIKGRSPMHGVHCNGHQTKFIVCHTIRSEKETTKRNK